MILPGEASSVSLGERDQGILRHLVWKTDEHEGCPRPDVQVILVDRVAFRLG